MNDAKYSSLGVTQGNCTEMLSLGRHSYSSIFDYYFQYYYEHPMFESSIKKGLFPIYRGHHLGKDDILRRDIIQTLRTNFFIDIQYIQRQYEIDFFKYFESELSELTEFINDKLVLISKNKVEITDSGIPFTLQMCRKFDKYLIKKG